MQGNCFLAVRDVVKRFASHTALDGVSINVPEGKIFGLLGPNGAGKTTLIRVINRITMPDSGEVLWDGRPMRAGDIYDIGYLPEERGLYKDMPVGDQAVYLAQLKGMSGADARRELTLWFQKFGIMDWWGKRVRELSKGMAQKVQFIITVLHKPRLLIFDEPFSGFDPVNTELLKREILELRRQGHTIIFSTHNMASVEEICDNIALVNHSRVVLGGNVEEVKNNFRTGRYELVCANGRLLGESGMYSVLRIEEGRLHTKYLLEKKAGVQNSELAAALAGQVEIRSFCEQIPSMNEIFLKVVSQNNNE